MLLLIEMKCFNNVQASVQESHKTNQKPNSNTTQQLMMVEENKRKYPTTAWLHSPDSVQR